MWATVRLLVAASVGRGGRRDPRPRRGSQRLCSPGMASPQDGAQPPTSHCVHQVPEEWSQGWRVLCALWGPVAGGSVRVRGVTHLHLGTQLEEVERELPYRGVWGGVLGERWASSLIPRPPNVPTSPLSRTSVFLCRDLLHVLLHLFLITRYFFGVFVQFYC